MDQSCGLLCEPFILLLALMIVIFAYVWFQIASWFFQADHHFNYAGVSVHSPRKG